MKDSIFNFEAFKKSAIDKIKAGEGLTGSDGAFTPLLKSFLEEALKGEIEILPHNRVVRPTSDN